MGSPPPPELPSHLPSMPGQPAVPTPPTLLPAPMSDRWKGVYWAPSTYLRGHLFIHAVAFWAIALDMAVHGERYTLLTNRGLAFLLAWLTAKEWGAVFGTVGLLKLLAGFLYPRLSRLAITGGILLLSWWAIGFVFSWLFGRATILGLVAWMLLIGEHFAAATLLDGRRRWKEPWPARS